MACASTIKLKATDDHVFFFLCTWLWRVGETPKVRVIQGLSIRAAWFVGLLRQSIHLSAASSFSSTEQCWIPSSHCFDKCSKWEAHIGEVARWDMFSKCICFNVKHTKKSWPSNWKTLDHGSNWCGLILLGANFARIAFPSLMINVSASCWVPPPFSF